MSTVTTSYDNLFAGDFPVVTETGTIVSGEAFAPGCYRHGSGRYRQGYSEGDFAPGCGRHFCRCG